jgi:hypothetical protein
MAPLESTAWAGDWAWGVPLIIGNVLMHVVGLNLIGVFLLGESTTIIRGHSAFADFVAVVGVTALLTTLLHAFESAIWGAAYLLLGALSDEKTAMLYSLGAMTTYGDASVHLNPRWELLGTMEALQGLLLFGLTTAFLFSIFQEVGPGKSGELDTRTMAKPK